MQRVRDLTDKMKNQVSFQKQIHEELETELLDLNKELLAKQKEHQRNDKWLQKKLQRFSLKSNRKYSC